MGASVVAALHPDLSPKRDWKFLLFGALLGIFPDFDYFLSWIRFLDRGWHHDFTHSILFAFTLGALAAAALRELRLGDGIKYGLAVLSHPLLDYVYTDSRGVELFWPFSDQRYALGMMPPIEYTLRRGSLYLKLIDLACLCLVELLVCGAVLVAILILRKMFRIMGQSGAAKREKPATS